MMIKHGRHVLIAIGLLLAGFAQAAEPVRIEQAWARATVPGQEVGAAYMQLTSAADLELVKAESPAAGTLEIHMMRMQDGVMEMRMLETLHLPAGKTVKLEPGGFHLMLIDLKEPLKDGGKVGVTLHFKNARGETSTQQVDIPVRKKRPD